VKAEAGLCEQRKMISRAWRRGYYQVCEREGYREAASLVGLWEESFSQRPNWWARGAVT
jgi:hypothetical protein